MRPQSAALCVGAFTLFFVTGAQAQGWDLKSAQARLVLAAALCKSTPITAQARNSGNDQLEELRTKVVEQMRSTVAASATNPKLSQFAKEVAAELVACPRMVDPNSFGSLGWQVGKNKGIAGTGGSVHVANGEDGPGFPGTRGTLYEVDPNAPQAKDMTTTYGNKRSTQLLDLQIKQLETQQQILQLQRDSLSKGGLPKGGLSK